MTTASDKLKQMGEKIAEKKSQASAIGAVFKFALEGEGGGNFIVNLKDNPGVTEGDGTAECTIRMTAQDFVELTEGKANRHQLRRIPQKHVHHLLPARSERHANSDFVAPPCHNVRNHAVKPPHS